MPLPFLLGIMCSFRHPNRCCRIWYLDGCTVNPVIHSSLLLSLVIATMVHALQDSAHKVKEHKHYLSMFADMRNDMHITNNDNH